MASKKIGLVLQRKFGRLTTVLIYAVLEWVLILLLLIDALLSFLTTKFAQYFGLQPPCLWCSRLDHILGNEEPSFYRKLICDLHAKEISSMGYCHTHKNLSDVNSMCEDCLLSFAAGNKPNSRTYGSLVGELGGDLECFAENEHENRLGSQMGNHSDGNERGIHMDFRMGNRRGKTEHDIRRGSQMDDQSVYNEHDILGVSQRGNGNLVRKSLEESARDCLINRPCSCCKTPLKSRLFSPWFVQTKLIDEQRQDEIHVPSRNAVVDFAEDVDREETLQKSIGYPESILHECTVGSKEALIELEGEDLSLNPLDHIGYTELKVTSDSSSEASISDVGNLSDLLVNDTVQAAGLCRQCLQRMKSPVEMISESPGKGLVCDLISDVRNCRFEPVSDEVILTSEVETHGNKGLEEYSDKPVEGIDTGVAPKQLTADNNVTMKAELETCFEARKAFPSDKIMPLFETPLLSSDGQAALLVSHRVERDGSLRDTELPHETLDPIGSSGEISIAMDKAVNKELSLEGSSGGILKHGIGELDWNNVSKCGHPSPASPIELKAAFAEIAHAEGTSSPKDLETNEVYFQTEVLKPDLPKELKGSSAQMAPVEGTSFPEDVLESIEEDFGTQDLNKGSGDIRVAHREDQLHSIGMDAFGDEEGVNKPQLDNKLLLRCLSGRGLNQADAENIPGVPGVITTADEYRTSDMHGSIEGLHMLHKRLVIERNDSGLESLDGSILSEIEGESAVDRLKRQIELDRKALNTLYSELEEERSASAIAANQAMAMITRLQEEKAAMQMEALQYQRMMEEQAEYDQEALQLLNEILVKREKEMKGLEKEVELYRKRLHYESTEKRREKRRKTSGEEIDSCFSCLEQNDRTLNDQYQKIKASSTSSLSEDSDESSSSVHEVEGDFDLQQSNQNTPAELTISAGGGYEEQTLDGSLDESVVDFEEERLCILERLKGLEEKLHILANDGEAECGEPQIEIPDRSMVHPKANIVPDEHCEVAITESKSAGPGTEVDLSIQEQTNGDKTNLPVLDAHEVQDRLKESHWDKDPRESMNIGKSDPLIGSRKPIARKVTGVKAKRLLPLFEATSFDEESLHQTEESYPANQTYDWRSVSMIARDNGRLAIEQEVYHLNERLQALEADREFLKYTIKSLTKGDKGTRLLQEIAQNLRELRRIEMKTSNLNDSFAQQNSFFIPSSKGNGELAMQPH